MFLGYENVSWKIRKIAAILTLHHLCNFNNLNCCRLGTFGRALELRALSRPMEKAVSDKWSLKYRRKETVTRVDCVCNEREKITMAGLGGGIANTSELLYIGEMEEAK